MSNYMPDHINLTNFTLTGMLAKKAAEIDSQAKLTGSFGGRCVSRLINLATCLTALVETIAHLVLGLFTTFTGAGIIGSIINRVCKKQVSPLTFSGGLKNLLQAVKFAPGIVFSPIAGFISPAFLSTWYNGALKTEPLIPKNSASTNASSSPDATRSVPTTKKETAAGDLIQHPEIPDAGRVIEYDWCYRDFKAKETINRAKPFVFLKESAEKELAYLETLDPSLPFRGITVKKRKEQLAKRITQCENNLRTRDWATSNYFRDFLRGNQALAPSLRIEDRLESYKQTMENEYLPACINMRSHLCSVTGGDTHVVERVGIISDMSNGFTNLKELKEIKVELEKNGTSKKLSTLKNKIQSQASKEKSRGNKFIDITAGYALNQVDNLAAVTCTIASRRMHLEDQFLQLVMQHINSNRQLEHLTDFPMIHVGLLCQDKEEIDKTGWNHHEANEMTDMAEIFNEFRGKSIIFDGTGPFIDEQGNIHVPKRTKQRSLTLAPFFVNSSVQGHSKKSKNKTAIDINQNTFAELKKRLAKHPNILKGFSSIFDKGNDTSYLTAIDLIYYAREAKLMISTGCLSAKDRTGFTCAGDSVLNQMEQLPLSGKRKFMKQQLQKDAPPVLVVRDNNPDTHIIKVTPFFIPKVTDTAAGVVARAGNYAKQGVEIMLERRRIEKQMNANKN